MIQTTVLHPKHLEAGAKMVDFHGWEMPINYGSQLEEHHAVRSDAGMFDVSHMTIVDLTGERVKAFLQHLLANDVAKLTVPGKALYSGMLNPEGGVIDDLITYYLTGYLLPPGGELRDPREGSGLDPPSRHRLLCERDRTPGACHDCGAGAPRQGQGGQGVHP